MATVKAANTNTPVHAGEYGNYSKEGRRILELGGAASGTVVQSIFVHGGTTIHDLELRHQAMGTSTTLKVGYEYVDSANGAAVDDYFLAAASSASAGSRVSAALNLKLMYDAYITITVGGATVDVGKYADLNLGYVYNGK